MPSAASGAPQDPGALVEAVLVNHDWLAGADHVPRFDPDAGVEEKAAELAEAEGIPLEEATRHVRLQNAYYPITVLAETLWPVSSAGAWLDLDSETVHVSLQGDALALEGRLRQHLAAHPDLSFAAESVVVSRADYSFTDLEEAYGQVNEILAAINLAEPIGVTADVRSNRVRVDVHRVSQALTAALQPLGSIVVLNQVPLEQVDGELQCTRTACASERTARGGMRYDHSAGFCTAGYAAWGRTGGRYILSAGHCHSGGQVTHAGSWFGHWAGTRTSQGRADAGRIYVDPNAGWTTNNWVYHSGPAQRLQMEARIDSAWCKANCAGTTLYKSGATSGLNSGRIIDGHSTRGGVSEAFSPTPWTAAQATAVRQPTRSPRRGRSACTTWGWALTILP